MSLPEKAVQTLQAAGFPVSLNHPLSGCGSFQLGGPARAMVTAASPAELRQLSEILRSSGVPFCLIGDGTNILFSDHGWPGIVVRFSAPFSAPEDLGAGHWRLPASLSLQDLVAWSIQEGWSGLVPFSGIPGTVGGAVVGNAGAWGIQLADLLVSVSGSTNDGSPFSIPAHACGFRYRDSDLKQQGAWVSEIVLALEPGDREDMEAERDRILSERARRHPDWHQEPCIGSFFKNLAPTSSAGRRQAAGWFLEQAGAKECSVGGAGVFSRHANILVKREPDCTAGDVAQLADHLKRAVREKHGIHLEREVRYLGDLPGWKGQPGFW